MSDSTKSQMTDFDNIEKIIPHTPFVPYYPDCTMYSIRPARPFLTPYEYTGWRDETMAWKKTCYLHGTLNPSPTLRFHGPDALKFLSDTCVNSFATFPIGSGKHGIMCNEDGLVMADGVIVRLGEDDFITYWMAPYMAYVLQKGSYNVTATNLTGKVFLFQLAGPRSLEVLEAATGQDFHDLKFMRQRQTQMSFASHPVSVLRMGMGGSLAYELHGDVNDARAVYQALVTAGGPFGLRRLGFRAYMMNHTENGYPQAFYHFPYPWAEEPDLVDFLQRTGVAIGYPPHIAGSMDGGLQPRYRNPVELGWSRMIKFDHNFVGRKALEKEVAHPRRKMVTLVWNSEDILDVHASQYRQGEPYQSMDQPNHFPGDNAKFVYYADKVLKDGKLSGISSGRAYSYHYREMLSLCSIDVECAEIGTEVKVLWGNPGTRQKEIRAIVSRFPYLDEGRNQDVDVNRVPRLRSGVVAAT
ncbi:glycine cleavage system aminomethyltransferase T [Bradyrhizobium sp. USDA 4449]